MTFCTDIDLLHWEPVIFKEAAFVSQTLLESTGDVAGTTFTLATGSLLDSHVEPGHVLHLDGAINGSFPIVEVTSETQAQLSVLYDRLTTSGGEAESSPPKADTGASCAVRTFWPQRQIVTELLLQSLGLKPDEQARVINPSSLKRACTLGVLQMIYNALAAAADEPGALTIRAASYERMYRRALRNARVELDLNGDGAADCVRALNVLRLERV